MTKTKKIVLACFALIIVGLLVYAVVSGGSLGTVKCPECKGDATIMDSCETCGGEGMVRGTWWALLPPTIAIGLALITKEVYSSLAIGLFTGGVIYATEAGGMFGTHFHPLSAMNEKEKERYRQNTIFGGIYCGTFLAAASIFQQMGIVYTTAGKAGFITAMYMLLVPVIGFVLLGKRNSWIVWLAVLMGVAGMYLLCMDGSFRLTRGDTLICICAVLFSGHILCCDHFVKLGNPIRISAIQFATCTVISSVAALILEAPTVDKIVSAAIPILYCGIISGGAGYTLQIVAQKFTDPTIASLLMSLESVFAVIAGALILGERMVTRELIGCVIMFAAIILVQIRGE